MNFEADILAQVLAFMVLSNRLVEMLAKPIFEKYSLDTFWLMYVSWGVAGVIVALAQFNLFVGVFPNEIVGLVLTAIVAGGGANLLHDLTDNK